MSRLAVRHARGVLLLVISLPGQAQRGMLVGSQAGLPTGSDQATGEPMPTVLKLGKWRFHFYSDEGSEPPHVHVDTGDGGCKFWLEPVRLARSVRVSVIDLRAIEREVVTKREVFLEAWHVFFRR